MAEPAGRLGLPLRYQVVFSTPPTHSPWRPGACRRAEEKDALLLSLAEPLPSGTVLHLEVYWRERRAVVELTGEILAAEADASGAAVGHRLVVLTISEEGRRVLLEGLSGP